MNKEITINKLEATLNGIKDSETILGGEYFKVHSDYIYALEEEINKIDNSTIIIKIGDAEEVRKTIETQKQEIDRLNNIIKEAKEFLTSYESINEIQQLEEPENNKRLDKDTIVEMVRRYLKVHDKLLSILELKEGNNGSI